MKTFQSGGSMRENRFVHVYYNLLGKFMVKNQLKLMVMFRKSFCNKYLIAQCLWGKFCGV